MSGKIAMVLSGFPRRSETFALNEIWALEQRGALAAIFATKAGEPFAVQPASKALLGRVQVLREGNAQRQAEEVAKLLEGTRVSGIHGYFAHAPAELAERVATLLGTRFGFSIHAKDARKVPHDVLEPVLARRHAWWPATMMSLMSCGIPVQTCIWCPTEWILTGLSRNHFPIGERFNSWRWEDWWRKRAFMC